MGQKVAGAQLSSTAREIIVAGGDETSAIKVAAGLVTFRLPHALTLTSIIASLTTAQGSGSVLIVDVKANGTSVFGTKLSFNNASKTTVGGPTYTFNTTVLAYDTEITIDVTQIGDGTGKGLKVTLIGFVP